MLGANCLESFFVFVTMIGKRAVCHLSRDILDPLFRVQSNEGNPDDHDAALKDQGDVSPTHRGDSGVARLTRRRLLPSSTSNSKRSLPMGLTALPVLAVLNTRSPSIVASGSPKLGSGTTSIYSTMSTTWPALS